MVSMKLLPSVNALAKSAILCAFLGLSLFTTQHSYAQTTPCDPEYMQALEARAWLEMNREITQNQNLIAKPDSVLEYTCFNHFLNEAADGHSPFRQFSETERWGAITGFSDMSTNTALEQVVNMAFQIYINTNFSHTYLGGRATIDYTGMGTVANATYACGEMAAVWQEAKCTDLFEYSRGGNPNLDGFMDFAWYRSNDPRDLPTACTPPPGMYNLAINTAFNNAAPQRQANRYYITSETDFNASPYDVDNVITHLDFILPEGDPLVSSCQTIQTGITVNRVGVSTYPDAICPNPGCHYDQSSCTP